MAYKNNDELVLKCSKLFTAKDRVNNKSAKTNEAFAHSSQWKRHVLGW